MLLESHCTIFKRSLGKFPGDQKKASTVPVFRIGVPQENYKAVRPVWLVPFLGRLQSKSSWKPCPSRPRTGWLLETACVYLRQITLHQAFGTINCNILIAKLVRPVQWVKNRLNCQAQIGCG